MTDDSFRPQTNNGSSKKRRVAEREANGDVQPLPPAKRTGAASKPAQKAKLKQKLKQYKADAQQAAQLEDSERDAAVKQVVAAEQAIESDRLDALKG